MKNAVVVIVGAIRVVVIVSRVGYVTFLSFEGSVEAFELVFDVGQKHLLFANDTPRTTDTAIRDGFASGKAIIAHEVGADESSSTTESSFAVKRYSTSCL